MVSLFFFAYCSFFVKEWMARRKRDEGERSEIEGDLPVGPGKVLDSANKSEIGCWGSMCNYGTSSYTLRISPSLPYLLPSEPLFPLLLLHTDCVVSVLSHSDNPVNKLQRVQDSSGESFINIF